MNKDRAPHAPLTINRRQFLLLTAGLGAGAGCQTTGGEGAAGTPATERVVNAGPAGNYVADGVYGGFSDQGFFVVRKGDRLLAYSSTCTHKKCRLIAEPDRSFHCKCHGSIFNSDGKVMNGPAKRDLPVFPAFVDGHGQLLVRVPAK